VNRRAGEPVNERRVSINSPGTGCHSPVHPFTVHRLFSPVVLIHRFTRSPVHRLTSAFPEQQAECDADFGPAVVVAGADRLGEVPERLMSYDVQRMCHAAAVTPRRGRTVTRDPIEDVWHGDFRGLEQDLRPRAHNVQLSIPKANRANGRDLGLELDVWELSCVPQRGRAYTLGYRNQ
jgi:hypothetical protein